MGNDAHAFILAGGRGTRFWPLSRHDHPKQLLDFTGEGSLLAQTVRRIQPLIPPRRQWVITSEDLADAVRAEAPEIPPPQILAEPMGRNTAPAIALASALLSEMHGDVPFAVLPSDHLIRAADRFREALGRALELAGQHSLLLSFGVVPSRAETGYGYIERGHPLEDATPAHAVTAFREKPERAVAEEYVRGGRHLWNSGIFVWKPSTVIGGLGRERADIMEPLLRLAAHRPGPGTEGFQSAFKRVYESLPSISIDYALMEKAENAAVIEAPFDWNDVGHWLAMRDLWPQDADHNAARGTVVHVDSQRNIVYGPDRLTALVGVDDLIVVHTPDATLVCHAARSQDLRELLEQLREGGHRDYL